MTFDEPQHRQLVSDMLENISLKGPGGWAVGLSLSEAVKSSDILPVAAKKDQLTSSESSQND